MSSNEPIVFISCGQRTEAERQLGREICVLVRRLTPFRPYFADTQSTLEGLTANILKAIDSAAGFIAIYHCRGLVSFPDAPSIPPFTRASVWVEQELAIAAYLTQVAGRSFPVAVFVEEGIQREGMRDQLLLNPHPFKDAHEVLDSLRGLLPQWKPSSPPRPAAPIRLTLSVQKNASAGPGWSRDALFVDVVNEGSEPLEESRLELQVPPELVDPGVSYGSAVSGRPGFFRITAREHRREPLYPGDTCRFFRFDYTAAPAGSPEAKAVATFIAKGLPSTRAELFLAPSP
jgi:hypothetical protein